MLTVTLFDKKARELIDAGVGELATGTFKDGVATKVDLADRPVSSGGPQLILPTTLHRVPFPSQPEVRTGDIASYVVRVYPDCGGTGTPGANPMGIVMGGMLQPFLDQAGGFKPDGSNWPEVADRFWDAQLRLGKYQPVADATVWEHTAAGGVDGRRTENNPTPPAMEVEVPITQE